LVIVRTGRKSKIISSLGLLALGFSSYTAYAAEGAAPPPPQAAAPAQPTGVAVPVDPALRPEEGSDIPDVFRDMGVVQKKAMNKAGRFLFATSGSLDFSDGPYSNYSFHFNPGYAVNDFFEVYGIFSPAFIQSRRGILDTVEGLVLKNDQQATLTANKPKMEFGVELLWAPLYGKDSLGLRRVIRSDTFFKFGASNISYEGGGSGLRFNGGVGKTFFVNHWLGARLSINVNYWQTILNEVKAFRWVTVVEGGPVFYF
jgi:hypothetical protein